MSNNEPVQDVFISYAHSDDEILLGAKAGWVTTFVDELKKLLRRKLGGSGATIWMDHQLTANEQVTATLMKSVACSRTLVLFMSPGYSMSTWCQKEIGNFLETHGASKNKENVFIVELDSTKRESWHPRLQELTPIRFWREDRDHVPQLLGCPVPNPDPDDPYWLNLNKLAHFIADYLKTHSESVKPDEKDAIIIQSDTKPQRTLPVHPPTETKKIIWIAEPTDDLIDQWEALAEALRQAGADLRPLGIDTYPRSTEAEFLASLHADLNKAHLFVQLLSQFPGRPPKDSTLSYTALQASAANAFSRQQGCAFLQWRIRDINLEQVTNEDHRRLLTGAIASGFEEFRQRVLAAVQSLNQPSFPPTHDNEDESLAICICAHKADYDLGLQVRDILVDLGADAFTTQTEPVQNQSPTEFNTQLDEVISSSEGMIIVYGQTPPVWVQAQYMRARKALAQQHKALWSALLNAPPFDNKPDAGVAGKNLMKLEYRDGLLHYEVERFVNTLRGEHHA